MKANGYEINVGDWWVTDTVGIKEVGRILSLDGPSLKPIVVLVKDIVWAVLPNMFVFPVLNPNSHNPDRLTAEQVTEGGKVPCRLLDKDEIIPSESDAEIEQIEILSAVSWLRFVVGSSITCTYRTKLTRAELAAAREAAKSKPKERKPLEADGFTIIGNIGEIVKGLEQKENT